MTMREANAQLVEFVREGLESPLEPDDEAFWRKRREALQQAIVAKPQRKPLPKN